MAKTVVNVRIDVATKKEIQIICRELGISVSSLVNAMLKHLVKTKKPLFMLGGKTLKKAMVEIENEAIKLSK
ncbi:MAG: type II toxin-antitoxin system RelB/DinJ family antitoxin [Patescibacteria group bacterium]